MLRLQRDFFAGRSWQNLANLTSPMFQFYSIDASSHILHLIHTHRAPIARHSQTAPFSILLGFTSRCRRLPPSQSQTPMSQAEYARTIIRFSNHYWCQIDVHFWEESKERDGKCFSNVRIFNIECGFSFCKVRLFQRRM